LADDVIEAGKVRHFIEACGPRLIALREGYKDRLALIFERKIVFENGDLMRDEIERIGAKLAVFGDFADDLGRALAAGDMAAAEQERKS
jgi:hypothetical protein